MTISEVCSKHSQNLAFKSITQIPSKESQKSLTTIEQLPNEIWL